MHNFPIAERKIWTNFDEGGVMRIIEGRKAILRTDTGEPLGVVSDKYQIVHHADVVSAFEKALDAMGPQFAQRNISTSLPHNGAKLFRKYTFPNIGMAITSRDIIKMTLELVNSYDGSMRVGYMYGAFRLACTNGLIIGARLQEFHTKHYNQFDVNRMVEMLQTAVPIFERSIENWRAWQAIEMNEESAREALKKAPPLLAGKTVEAIIRRFKEFESHTKWGLFQAATWVTSHEVSAKNVENQRHTVHKLEGALVPVFYGKKLPV